MSLKVGFSVREKKSEHREAFTEPLLLLLSLIPSSLCVLAVRVDSQSRRTDPAIMFRSSYSCKSGCLNHLTPGDDSMFMIAPTNFDSMVCADYISSVRSDIVSLISPEGNELYDDLKDMFQEDLADEVITCKDNVHFGW